MSPETGRLFLLLRSGSGKVVRGESERVSLLEDYKKNNCHVGAVSRMRRWPPHLNVIVWCIRVRIEKRLLDLAT